MPCIRHIAIESMCIALTRLIGAVVGLRHSHWKCLGPVYFF
jgi:hypothetical protein